MPTSKPLMQYMAGLSDATQVIVDVAPPGLLRREAERALELFRDPKRAGCVVVTLPEDMPANETLELHEALTKDLHMPVPALVVNQLLPKLFTPEERPLVAGLPSKLPEHSPIESLAAAGRARALREAVQESSLERLASLSVPRLSLPRIFEPELGRHHVESLSHAFD